MKFVFSNIEFLFFSDLSEAGYFVDELHLGCSPTIGLRSYWLVLLIVKVYIITISFSQGLGDFRKPLLESQID
jgi:hypothetical protein